MSERIGMIVPFDMTSDPEYWSWVPSSATIHITRTKFCPGDVTIGLVREIADSAEIQRCTQSLLAISPSVVAFGCTSASFVDGSPGERRLREAMVTAGAPVAVTTSGALLHALEALRARGVSLATPYSDALGTRLVDYVRGAGFQVVASVNLGVESIAGISNLSADEIETLAAKAVTPDTDVLFISCTALRTFSLIPQLEARFRIPVITANQVTMWAAMRAASIPATLSGQMLFDKTPSAIALHGSH